MRFLVRHANFSMLIALLALALGASGLPHRADGHRGFAAFYGANKILPKWRLARM